MKNIRNKKCKLCIYDEQRNLGSGDEKYKYPYPNQPFYTRI